MNERRHGRARYNKGCRCDECRTATRNYSRERRWRLRPVAVYLSPERDHWEVTGQHLPARPGCFGRAA